MLIIDADAHYVEPYNWLEQVDPELSALIPYEAILESLLTGTIAEMLASVPEQHRPDLRSLIPEPAQQFLETISKLPSAAAQEFIALNQGQMDKPNYLPEHRLADMDAQGVDLQLLHPNHAVQTLFYIKREMPQHITRVYSAYNTWSAQVVQGAKDRLMPVAMITLEDVDWAIRELERMHQIGCRCFLFDVAPVNGLPLSHDKFDRFWATSAELNMVATLHIGLSQPVFASEYAVSKNLEDIIPIIFNQTSQIPEVFFTSMIYRGVFARYPNLRFLVAEYGISWLSHFLLKMELHRDIDAFQIMTRPWSYPKKPVEYAKDQIRVSPLRHDDESLPMLAAAEIPNLSDRVAQILNYSKEMLVFSSDYPHMEGLSNAVEFWQDTFTKLGWAQDQAFIKRFFGDAMQECLKV